MKIKGVIEDLKKKEKIKKLKKIIMVKIYLGISLHLLWQCGVSSVSDSSLFQLILLKIYRPLPM